MDPRHRNRWMAAFAVLLPMFIFWGCSGDTADNDSGVGCTQDEECAIGEYCKNGVCTPFGGDDGPQTCSNDSDCPAGEICEDGICTPGTRPDGGQDGEDGLDGSDHDPDGGGDEQADQDTNYAQHSRDAEAWQYKKLNQKQEYSYNK